jgi:hypothetical protein
MSRTLFVAIVGSKLDFGPRCHSPIQTVSLVRCTRRRPPLHVLQTLIHPFDSRPRRIAYRFNVTRCAAGRIAIDAWPPNHGASADTVELFPARDASGTAWLPNETPMFGSEQLDSVAGRSRFSRMSGLRFRSPPAISPRHTRSSRRVRRATSIE